MSHRVVNVEAVHLRALAEARTQNLLLTQESMVRLEALRHDGAS